MAEKQDVLFIGPNKRYRFFKCEVFGKHAVDHKGGRAWHLLPRFVVPIMKGKKILGNVLIVTEASELPVDPTGKNDYEAPETLTCMDGLAELQSMSYRGKSDDQNWIVMAIVLLVIVIGIVTIVAMLKAFY